jgi:hypothetical protein
VEASWRVFRKISRALKKRAVQIELLLMDVDGTMTDGGVILLSQTEDVALEIKTFDAHDGQGLTLAQHCRPSHWLHLPDVRARQCFGVPTK